MVEHYNIKRMR